jgi:hypothetical protein
MPHPRTWGPELRWPSQGNWTFPHANVINELVKLWCISAISKLTRCPSVLQLTRLDFFQVAEFCFPLFAEAPGVQAKTPEVAQPHSPRAQGTCAGSQGSFFPSRGHSSSQSKIGTTQRGGLWYPIWSPLMYGWGHSLEAEEFSLKRGSKLPELTHVRRLNVVWIEYVISISRAQDLLSKAAQKLTISQAQAKKLVKKPRLLLLPFESSFQLQAPCSLTPHTLVA